MKKIYYLEKHPVKIGDVIEHYGFRVTVTEELIGLNPELFLVKDTIQELLDKAKRDYPIGTVFDNGSGMQKVTKDNYEWSSIHKQVLVTTDKYFRGGTIYSLDKGWSKILPLKFTTEDGVNIYGDMKTYIVYPNDIGDISYYHGPWNGCSEGKGNKYFYHKENALAYIEKHKEKTLRDYENSLSLSMWGWFKIYEPKLYYTKILQLIADDLHEERYTHIHMNTSYHINNAYGVNVHCGYDEGCVYFKSSELAIKARDILGDKVKYLFK